MYYLNKIVWLVLNPVSLVLETAMLGWLAGFKFRWLGKFLVSLALAGLFFFSIPATTVALGRALEEPYAEKQTPESLPEAEAIVLLGGGMLKTRTIAYPDMNDAADRVWHAARLWKAGNAPIVVVTGVGELNGAVPLLKDLGVPDSAILVDDASRNTYENARFTETLLKSKGYAKPKVLLVTSAWHMTRAMGNFAETDIECIPAATDFRVWPAVNMYHRWKLLVPDAGTLSLNATLAKEWLGRLARK